MLKKIKKVIVGFLAVWGALAILSALTVGVLYWIGRTRLPDRILLEADFQGPYVEHIPNDSAAQVLLARKPVMRDV
ncbi:MAG: hypothetical protein ACOC3A_03875, partial [Thermodesulfobacteriota bacterium]